MHFLFSLIMVLLLKNGNSFPNDPGDRLDPELNTDQQETDFSGMGADAAAFGNLAADQGDIGESINPEISVADSGVGTAYPSSTKVSATPDIFVENSQLSLENQKIQSST